MSNNKYYSDENNEEWNDDDFKSKSEIKRELLELKELGRELIALPVKDLKKLDLTERLMDAVLKAQPMTHGALKREIGRVGKIMVDEDYEQIQENLKKIKQAHNGEVKQFHQLELWRDELLAGDKEVMNVLVSTFEGLDIQYVRQLIRNAQKEAKQEKTPKSARLLFKYLQEQQAALNG
jgi:ribosome-associated protein